MLKILKNLNTGEGVPFCLHESTLINYFFSNKSIRLRFAVNENFLEDFLENKDVEVKEESNYYIIDFVAKDCKIEDLCWFGYGRNNVIEVLSFNNKSDVFSLYLETSCSAPAHIEFSCSCFKWESIAKISLKELKKIEESQYFSIEKLVDNELNK